MCLVILRYCQNIEVSHYFEILCLIFEQLSQNIEILYHYFQILSHYFEDSHYNDLQLLFFSPSSFAVLCCCVYLNIVTDSSDEFYTGV